MGLWDLERKLEKIIIIMKAMGEESPPFPVLIIIYNRLFIQMDWLSSFVKRFSFQNEKKKKKVPDII